MVSEGGRAACASVSNTAPRRGAADRLVTLSVLPTYIPLLNLTPVLLDAPVFLCRIPVDDVDFTGVLAGVLAAESGRLAVRERDSLFLLGEEDLFLLGLL